MIKRDPWLPMKRWALAALVLILLPVACHQAQAAALYQATIGEVVVTLHDDPCPFSAVVANLKFYATWRKGEDLYVGCWAPFRAGVVAMYFVTDRKVEVLPFSAFDKLERL